MIYNKSLNDYGKMCGSCTIYIVLFVIFFMISISIILIFTSDTNITNINSCTETAIY